MNNVVEVNGKKYTKQLIFDKGECLVPVKEESIVLHELDVITYRTEYGYSFGDVYGLVIKINSRKWGIMNIKCRAGYEKHYWWNLQANSLEELVETMNKASSGNLAGFSKIKEFKNLGNILNSNIFK